MKFTELEVKVFNTIAAESMSGGLLDTSELCEATGISKHSVGGVIASLVKKGKIEVEYGEDHAEICGDAVYWPVHPEHGACFWSDVISIDEYQELLLTEGENRVETEDAAPYESSQEHEDTDERAAEDKIIAEAKRIIKRRFKALEPAITTPHLSCSRIQEYLHIQQHGEPYESFGAVFLDKRYCPREIAELFTGSIDSAPIYPRIVVERALKAQAASVVVFHNHPSGVPEPTESDLEITRKLKDALNLVDIRLLDHFIVADGGTVSLALRGLV